jgi:hypothetical protein
LGQRFGLGILNSVDRANELVPSVFYGRQEQGFFIPEMPVDGTLANASSVGDFLDVSLGVALRRERLHSGVEDLERSLCLLGLVFSV